MTNISVTVSGSFHRYLTQIREAVYEFKELGVQVLSPTDPRVVDSVGHFLFVASDQHRSIRLVQDRHLASISQSNLLWLVAPDGYIGQSASLELGFAIAYGIPIFSESLPPDLTLRQYILQVTSIRHLIEDIRQAGSLSLVIEHELSRKKDTSPDSLLIDPTAVVNLAHDKLEAIKQTLVTNKGRNEVDSANKVITELEELNRLLYIPSLYHRK